LPGVVAAKQPHAVKILLRRIAEQLQQILQQQQQQQQGQGSEPAGKRQRLELGARQQQQQQQQTTSLAGQPQGAAGTAADMHDRLAAMLLNAHDAAMLQEGGFDLEWRLPFLQVLQRAVALHGPLLWLLLASMAGSEGEYDPQQVSVFVSARDIVVSAPWMCMSVLLVAPCLREATLFVLLVAPLHALCCRPA
jgi:hypothetical protein